MAACLVALKQILPDNEVKVLALIKFRAKVRLQHQPLLRVYLYILGHDLFTTSRQTVDLWLTLLVGFAASAWHLRTCSDSGQHHLGRQPEQHPNCTLLHVLCMGVPSVPTNKTRARSEVRFSWPWVSFSRMQAVHTSVAKWPRDSVYRIDRVTAKG